MNLRRMALVLTMLVGASASRTAADDTKAPVRTINVTGSAKVNVVPDEVVMVVGVEIVGSDLDKTKKQVDEAVQKAMALTKERGVEPKDVQTDQLEMHPAYDRNDAHTLVGYTVSNQIAITLRDVSKREGLITALFKAGLNTLSSIDFRTSKLRQCRDQARVMAVRAAKEKAELLARELGMKVGKPLNIIEQGSPGYYGYGGRYNRWSMAQQNQQNAAANAGGADTDDEGTVALGQIGISASVQVTFELVDGGS